MKQVGIGINFLGCVCQGDGRVGPLTLACARAQQKKDLQFRIWWADGSRTCVTRTRTPPRASAKKEKGLHPPSDLVKNQTTPEYW